MRTGESATASPTMLVLAGGLGTRLRPVTNYLPKILAPIAGKPFLHYVLRYLRSQSISDIILCTGYGADQVVNYCKDGTAWDVRIRYSLETQLLGTGGAIKHAEPLIVSSSFLVMNGDSLVKADLAHLTRFHAEKDAQITIVLVEVPDRIRFGSVVLANDNSIVGFNEKGNPGNGLISAGIYFMKHTILGAIQAGCVVSLERDVFPRLVGKSLYGMVVPGPFIDIGTPEAYAMAHSVLLHEQS